jgi:hypothetical protein
LLRPRTKALPKGAACVRCSHSAQDLGINLGSDDGVAVMDHIGALRINIESPPRSLGPVDTGHADGLQAVPFDSVLPEVFHGQRRPPSTRHWHILPRLSKNVDRLTPDGLDGVAGNFRPSSTGYRVLQTRFIRGRYLGQFSIVVAKKVLDG